MSDVALKWAAEQRTPDPLSKFLLFRLAAYADAEGCVWVFVDRLKGEMGVSDRTVQMRLKVLFETGLLEETGRSTRTRSNRLVPVRRLRMETNGRPLVGVLNEGSATGEDTFTRAKPSTGEADFTPTGEADFTRIRKEGERKESSNELSPRKRDVADAFAKWIAVYPNKVEQRAAYRLFERVLRKRTASVDELMAGAQRYAISVHGRPTAMVKSPTTWLLQECWIDGIQPETPDHAAPPIVLARVLFPGPSVIRATAVADRGEDWVSAWLDPCGWDAAGGQLIPRTGFAADRIQREIGRQLAAAGVKIGPPASAGRDAFARGV